MEPTLQSVIDQKTLKWIFVGGKGGVGKTTTSSSLAIQLSKHRESVLLISTDPAHNLSDAFGKKIGKDPVLVEPFSNLYAMEVDPTSTFKEMVPSSGGDSNMINELTGSFPGIDEAMGFAQIMKLIKNMKYEVIVFDTAPTGHTLRFLQFPTMLRNALDKFTSMGSMFGGMFETFMKSTGVTADTGDMMTQLNEMTVTINEVIKQFENKELTTFICVCIAEFLSMYETERMIQDLSSFSIDVRNIVINQILFPEQDSTCKTCLGRKEMQEKYLVQIEELYDDFHLVKLPLQRQEIRGSKNLEEFSEYLINPYQ